MSQTEAGSPESIETGQLKCNSCGNLYPVLRHIPRFVPEKNYAASFGFEWNRHPNTQYDSYSKTQISETRFFEATRWARRLEGQVILEVGSGGGRFTEQAAGTGAMVVSLDYSQAVEANYRFNGHKANVLIVQGDLYAMPFRKKFFDKLFCFGVLQHTPDVQKAFLCLPLFLKPGGQLAIDVYKRKWWRYLLVTRYWIRWLTRHIPPETLYKMCDKYVRGMWPLVNFIHRLPGGMYINWALLIREYRDLYPLTEEQLKEWAVLDTFDGLSAYYDKPQKLSTVQQWFEESGLINTEVHYGHNGIEGRGEKPAEMKKK
ncbi:MAG: class I SAM-dependent methyltransferase [Candidatus Omnitrophica bacterium]|nr:class I SAM-dependent methyltransferase [Candidatus Omnitrophota bacterium]